MKMKRFLKILASCRCTPEELRRDELEYVIHSLAENLINLLRDNPIEIADQAMVLLKNAMRELENENNR